jgi:hypothetical protein
LLWHLQTGAPWVVFSAYLLVMERIMNSHKVAWIILIGIMLLSGGCVVPGNTGSKQGNAASSKVKPVMKVCERDITAADLLRSPAIRQGMRDLIQSIALEQEAARQGAQVDPADLAAQRERTMYTVISSNRTWDEFLSSQNKTDEEWEDKARLGLLIVRLAELRAGITEDDYLERWETDRDGVVAQYIRQYHAAESERDKITYEDCRMILKDLVFKEKAILHHEDIKAELLNNATLDLAAIFSADEAAKYEDLILYSVQIGGESKVPGSLSGAGMPGAGSSAPEAGQVQQTQPAGEGTDAVTPEDSPEAAEETDAVAVDDEGTAPAEEAADSGVE